MTEQLPYVVEPMTLDDVAQVMEIEQAVFTSPWSARAYRYEITKNDHSTMLVVRSAGTAKDLLGHLKSQLGLVMPLPVLGYAGLWILVDETHICTIAVHPQWQGRGLGDLLLLSLLDESKKLGAIRSTLEVRVSNNTAIALYQKYGFEIVSRRKRYYIDNNEDAYLMTTPPFETRSFQANLDCCRQQLRARLLGSDAIYSAQGKAPNLILNGSTAPPRDRQVS
jgi:[ribosomal protein S18]-alanine N-acetyltransferase